MKIACFSMVRNESLLIRNFIEQANEFFDYLYILDHDSMDNTVDIISKRANQNTQLFFLKSTGYPQSEATTFFARKIFNETDVDYLFLLDADEYLPFDNRQELEIFLLKHQSSDVIDMYWCNLSPADLNSNDVFSGNFSYSATSKINSKVVLSKSVNKISNWQIVQGNHALVVDMNINMVTTISEQPLYHIPIQNMTQLYLKMLAGTIRLQGSKILRIRRQGTHWETYAKFLSSNAFSNDDILAMIFFYGESHALSAQPKTLSFSFPYIKERKNPTHSINGHLIGIIQQLFHAFSKYESSNYVITDTGGRIIVKHDVSYVEWFLKLARMILAGNYYKMKAYAKNYF